MIVDDCSPAGGVSRRDKSARGDVSTCECGAAGGVGPACGCGLQSAGCQTASRLGFCCALGFFLFFCSFKCLLFTVTLFVIAAEQISPQGAIKLEMNYTELHWKERNGTAGSLATASWCKKPELEEYAHAINPKRVQTKVPRIRNFPPAFVCTSSSADVYFSKKSNSRHPRKTGRGCSGACFTTTSHNVHVLRQSGKEEDVCL